MMKRLKKVLSFSLALCMILTILPVSTMQTKAQELNGEQEVVVEADTETGNTETETTETVAESVDTETMAESVDTETADTEKEDTEVATNDSVNEVKIGETEYATFAQALSAAREGDTITLLQDVKQDWIILSKNQLSIDLNHYTLTGNICIYGNCSILNGTLADGLLCVENDSQCNVTDCTFTSPAGISKSINSQVNGKLVLTNVTMDETHYVESTNGTITLSGGIYDGAIRPENAKKFQLLQQVQFSELAIACIADYLDANKTIEKLENGYYSVTDAVESDYVARIGSKKYVTLQQAVNKAKSGDTIYALKNISQEDEMYRHTMINKNGIVIDMQNFSYKGQISAAGYYTYDEVTNASKFHTISTTVKNLTCADSTLLDANENCTLNIYDVKQSANKLLSLEGYVSANGKGKINIYSGKLNGNLGIGTNAKVTILGGSYNFDWTELYSSSTLTVKGGVFSKNAYQAYKNFVADAYKYTKNTNGTYTCKLNGYNVAFKGNGATSGSTAAMPELKNNTSYKLRSNGYKRTGYTFKGWNTKANGSGKTYKDKASVKNLVSTGKTITLYATWKINTYKITYKLNSGKNSSKNPATYKVTSKAITLQNPSRKGYTFKGWYLDSKYKTKVKTINKGSSGNKTLYAKWSKK